MAHGLQGFPQSSYYGKSRKGNAPAIPETPVVEETPIIPETVAPVDAPILNETTTKKSRKKKTETVVETPVEE